MINHPMFFLDAMVVFIWLVLAGWRSQNMQYYLWALLILVIAVRAIWQRIKKST